MRGNMLAMDGALAQTVALTCHANAYLQGRLATPFFASNSTCKFCESVTFVDLVREEGAKLRQVPFAASPDEWFAHLASGGITGVRLRYGPGRTGAVAERLTVGFVGGGGEFRVCPCTDRDEHHWFGKWEVGDRNRKDNRLWRVTYGRLGVGPRSAEAPSDLDAKASSLRRALTEIAAFAERYRAAPFAKCFRTALATLDDQRTEAPYHDDLAPPGVLSASAAALLLASQQAWVFGAMGSWNDAPLDVSVAEAQELQPEYDRVSEHLYRALLEAIPAAASASMAAPP
jgi:hypothetical protein